MRKEIKPQDRQLLQNYLRKVEEYLIDKVGNVNPRLIKNIEEYLIKSNNLTKVPFYQTLENFSDIGALVGQFKEVEYGKRKKSKHSILKLVLYFLGGTIIIIIVTVTILIKSITPLYEYDKETKTVKLLGGKYQFQEGLDYKFNLHRFNSKLKYNNSLKGEFSKEDFVKVNILAKRMDLKVIPGKSRIKYNCRVTQEPNDLIDTKKKILSIDFKYAAKCLFEIPPGISWAGYFDRGKVKIGPQFQNFEVNLLKGFVHWDLKKSGAFQADLQAQTGLIKGDRSYLKKSNASFKAKIFVQAGIIKLN